MSASPPHGRPKAGSPPPGGVARSAGVPTILRAGFEGSGSPRWLMRTIQRDGLDAAQGFALDLAALPEGGRHGTLQALADGHSDLADADRQALAAARADGLPLVAVAPYGRILGSVVLRRGFPPVAPANAGAQRAADVATGQDSGVRRNDDGLFRALATLVGARLGVLSTQDKNWALLAATCAKTADCGQGFDLAACTTPVPLPNRAALLDALDSGDIDAALVHWHLVPRLLAAGHRLLAELPALADALGLADEATTHFVMREADVAVRPDLVHALRAALTAAASRLATDDAPWRALASEGAFDPALIDALRPRWQARVGRYLTSPDLSRSDLP